MVAALAFHRRRESDWHTWAHVVLQPESLASKVLLKWKVVGSILAQHHELFLTGTCTTNLVVFCLRNGYAYESHLVNEWIGSNSK